MRRPSVSLGLALAAAACAPAIAQVPPTEPEVRAYSGLHAAAAAGNVAEIERLITARRDARLARNFGEADRIRKDLETRGIILEDTGSTTRWKKK